MEILGTGADIIECARIGKMIERHGEYFLERVYTAREIAYCQAHRAFVERFAGRWAAKEAILKAIGTGWRKGISWLDVEIRNQTSGRPYVTLAGAAGEHASARKIHEIHISISHCRAFAMAHALAVGPGGAGNKSQTPDAT